jgi:hypothetical protein
MTAAPGRRDPSKERELSMKRKSLIFGTLAVAILGSVLLVGAYSQDPQDSQEPCFPGQISVPGGESRAALEEGPAGLWIFRITKVTGSVSRVEIQIYENALPTAGTKDVHLFAVCASCPDPYGRPQDTCDRNVSGPIATAGSLSIKRVKVDATGAITLDAGVYCVRPLAFGKGAVTVSIEHP